MAKRTLAFLLLLSAYLHAGQVTGTVVTSSGAGVQNGTLTFTLSQAAVKTDGTGTVATTPSYCYTSTDGTVVGLPNPQVAPVITVNAGGGSFGGTGTFYVAYRYKTTGGTFSLLSPYTTFAAAAGSSVTVNVPALQPGNADGYEVYMTSSALGLANFYLQYGITGWTTFTKTTAINVGTPLVDANTSICSLLFNDTLTPSYTTYKTSLVDANGSSIAGFPQNYYLEGSSVNIGNLVPAGNLVAKFPTAIVAIPSAHAQQSISGPLTLQQYKLSSGNVNGIRFVDTWWSGSTTETRTNAACSDLAGANGTVAIPTGTASGLTSALVDNCTLLDLRGGASNAYGTYQPTAFTHGWNFWLRWTNALIVNQTNTGLGMFIDSAKGGTNTGTLGATTKANYSGLRLTLNASTPGQHTGADVICQKYSAGDCFGIVGFSEMWGGSRPGNGDEGANPLAARLDQGTDIFLGTVTSKASNTLTFGSTTAQNTLGAGARWLINKTTGVYSTGTASFAIGSTTVTGIGTTWTGLALAPTSYCFSLDAEEFAGRKFILPVTAVTDNTHLTVAWAPVTGINTTAGTYKLFPCSEVAEVVSNDKVNISPTVPVQVTLVDATNFAVNDVTELPLSPLLAGTATSIVIRPSIQSTQSVVGLGISNQPNSGSSFVVPNAVVIGGNFNRGIEWNAKTRSPQFGFMFANGDYAPGILLYIAESAAAGDGAVRDIFNINKHSALAGTVYLRYSRNNGNDEIRLSGTGTGTGPDIFTANTSNSANAFRVQDASSQTSFRVGGTNNGNVDLGYGHNLNIYSDGFVTSKFSVTGATGNVTATSYQTATNCSSAAAPAVCASAAAGSVVIAAAATTVTVNTTAVTANSQIQLTRDDSLGTKLGVTCNTQGSLVLGAPRVTARTAATSFQITIDVGPTTNPMCISYTIVN